MLPVVPYSTDFYLRVFDFDLRGKTSQRRVRATISVVVTISRFLEIKLNLLRNIKAIELWIDRKFYLQFLIPMLFIHKYGSFEKRHVVWNLVDEILFLSISQFSFQTLVEHITFLFPFWNKVLNLAYLRLVTLLIEKALPLVKGTQEMLFVVKV
jgi:hypothetical protein